MGNGWIKLFRKITDSWLWSSDEPFDRRSAWIDLLLLANHEDGKTFYRGKLINCKRGTVYRSISFLAERWGWNRKTVKRFLSVLESDGMVSMKGTTQGTTITIENYGKFQDVGTTKGTTQGTTTGQRWDSRGDNEIRRIKKEKEGKEERARTRDTSRSGNRREDYRDEINWNI